MNVLFQQDDGLQWVVSTHAAMRWESRFPGRGPLVDRLNNSLPLSDVDRLYLAGVTKIDKHRAFLTRPGEYYFRFYQEIIFVLHTDTVVTVFKNVRPKDWVLEAAGIAKPIKPAKVQPPRSDHSIKSMGVLRVNAEGIARLKVVKLIRVYDKLGLPKRLSVGDIVTINTFFCTTTGGARLLFAGDPDLHRLPSWLFKGTPLRFSRMYFEECD